MAEETDLSRTEPASPRRLQQARSAGDVPRSAELTGWVVLLSALGMLGWLAPRLLNALRALTEVAFMHAAQPLSPVFIEAAQSALWAVLPVLAAIFVAALGTRNVGQPRRAAIMSIASSPTISASSGLQPSSLRIS